MAKSIGENIGGALSTVGGSLKAFPGRALFVFEDGSVGPAPAERRPARQAVERDDGRARPGPRGKG